MIAPYHQTAALITDAKAGDEEAWQTLFDVYSERVFGMLLSRCRDPELAEELTQATFVRMFERIDTYKEQGCFVGWLLRVATNYMRDEMRARGPRPRSIDLSPGGAIGRLEASRYNACYCSTPPDCPSVGLLKSESRQLLREAVDKLSEREQHVLRMRFEDGLSSSQIARTTKTPLGTVLARASRAQHKLRKVMAR